MQQSNLTIHLRSYSQDLQEHRHDYHQLVLPVNGSLAMNIDGQEGKVSADQIAVVAAGRNHGFASTDENCFVVADVPASLAPDLERLPMYITLDAALMDFVSFLHREKLQNTGNRSSERQMLLLLIQLLQERYGDTLRLDKRVEAARSYLDQNFYRPISLAQLATLANLSPRRLSELFRLQMGMTPNQYLLEKRMQIAWQLLEAGHTSIQQVAERVGFGSLSAFSDRFRRHFGQSPSYFRQMSKNVRQSSKDAEAG
jgi:AraC-like DNA-binding protein